MTKLQTTLVAATSADGKIASVNGKQDMLTCPADQKHLRDHMDAADLLVIGRITFEEHQLSLRSRKCAIVTSQVSTPQELRDGQLLWNPEYTTFQQICARFQARSICLLGGSKVYSLFLENGWIDDLVLTYAPNVELPKGKPLFENHGSKKLWSELNSGELGFSPIEITHLPGTEPSEFPLELRRFRKV